MQKKDVMALDAGTTSNRAIIFDEESRIVSVSQKEFTQYFPQPGWVEHDANEILHTMVEVMKGALEQSGLTAADISAIGITNQRETAVVWDKTTGCPIYNAIVWQSRQTAAICEGPGRRIQGKDGPGHRRLFLRHEGQMDFGYCRRGERKGRKGRPPLRYH